MAETMEVEPETLNESINRAKEVETKPDIQDSSSSDSESDDEAVEDLYLEALEKDLAENPSNYEAHVKYIACLRKIGEVDKLRQARESMSELFPLSPKMWQEWAKDEAMLSNGNEAFAAIEKLYQRGVHDYLSIPLWCDYINFVQEHDPIVSGRSQDGVTKMRDLFERALTAGGLHVAEGNRIWQAYLEYERAIYNSINDSHKEKEKQAQRIRSIFHRQLSIPLDDPKSMLLAYKAWEVEQGSIPETSSENFEEIPPQVAKAYQKAMEMNKARALYEEQISRQEASTERFQHFMTYLKFEQSSGSPARVQILFERAVTEFPVSNDLWLAYTRYLDQYLKVPKVVINVYSRAIRNCPWIGELWVQYLLSLERSRVSEMELSNVFERSLQCTFSSFEEYLDLFLTRIDGFRRRICLPRPAEDVLDYAMIRDTFQRAAAYLSPHLHNTDGLLRLYSYWARLEWSLGKDFVAARGVWESFLKTSGFLLDAWKQYILMEIETEHINEARSIYKRCYSKRFIGTGSEEICHCWLRFEREFGTLEDYDHAVKKVTPRLAELQLFRSKQESEIAASGEKNEDVISQKTSQKRKTGANDEHPTPKRQKGTAQNPTQALEKESNTISIEEKSKSIKAKAGKPETANLQQTNLQPSREAYKDQCTAFLSNLSYQVKDEHLRAFFSDVGGVTAIRLLKDKFTGKSRGLAYVDFTDDKHLAAAVAMNKKTLLGKKVSIARSDPKRSKKESSGRNSRELGKGAGPSSESGTAERPDSQVPLETSKDSIMSHERKDDLQQTRKNTFAVPRAVIRPLGRSKNDPNKQEKEETLKSNDEFRKMLLK